VSIGTSRASTPPSPAPKRLAALLAVALAVVVAVLAARHLGTAKPILAETVPRCANHKLPSFFVSDPAIVSARGGNSLLSAAGTDEAFALSTTVPSTAPVAGADGSRPPEIARSSARPGGGAYGDGTIGMTTVVRPDAGTLLLAVAQDEADRETGLMCVTKMATRVGMIFVFDGDARQNFWMKDTLIPLDMLFVDHDGRVTHVAANVPSARIDAEESTLARRSGLGKFVIELNAGEAASDDIRPGTHLEIPPLAATD